jgi:hypothetical protein
MFILVIDLYVADAGELLHGVGEGLGDVVRTAIRLAVADQVDTDHAVLKLHSAITHETVQICYQAL